MTAEITLDTAPHLLYVKEAAAILRTSEWSVYQLIRSGELPSLTLGRKRRIQRDTLRRFLAEREAASQIDARG